MTLRSKLALAALLGSAVASASTPSAIADSVVVQETIIHYPSERRNDEDNETRKNREVTVEIVARGSAWADIYLDDRRVFSPRGLRRSKQLKLKPGTYNIRAVNGTDYFDVWAEGYLHISHDEDVEFIVISFAENGRVRLAGDPNAWIPLSARQP